MSKIKHTTGPWVADNPDEFGDCNVHPANDPLVVVVAVQNGFRLNSETQANARLAAAAPELSAELRKAETFIAGFEDDAAQKGVVELLAGIRAAIAKADG